MARLFLVTEVIEILQPLFGPFFVAIPLYLSDLLETLVRDIFYANFRCNCCHKKDELSVGERASW